MSLIYMAYPIDQTPAGSAGTTPSREWFHEEKHRLSRDLAAAGHDVYRPGSAFEAGQRGPAIQYVNRAALEAAGAIVALVPAGVPTLGVPSEIEQAIGAGKPLLIVTDLTQSTQLADWADRGGRVAQAARPGDIEQGLAWLQRQLTVAQIKVKPCLVFEAIGSRYVDGDFAEDSLLPRRGYQGDAGLDLLVSADVEIGPSEFADVPCGVRVDIPGGMFGFILGRSSTMRKRGLMVYPGVIDEGWTGPLFAGIQNMTGETVQVRSGERVAQLLLLPASAAMFTPTWGTVPAKIRGEQGFGSTGS